MLLLSVSFNTVNGKCCCNGLKIAWKTQIEKCFNTVNGKCCCNSIYDPEQCDEIIMGIVSIP